MTVETHAIILNEGEDVINELFKNMENGELMTKLTSSSFTHIVIKNLKFVRIADPHETDHHNNKSIWVEVTISF